MYKIQEGYFIHFARVNKVYRKLCYQSVEEYHFTPNEIEVMMFLSNNPGMDSASDIAYYKNISKGLGAKSVESLYNKGFIKTEKDTKDRRLIHLILTEQSADVVKRLQSCKKEFIRQLQEGVTEEDLAAMDRATAIMNKNLDEMVKGVK